MYLAPSRLVTNSLAILWTCNSLRQGILQKESVFRETVSGTIITSFATLAPFTTTLGSTNEVKMRMTKMNFFILRLSWMKVRWRLSKTQIFQLFVNIWRKSIIHHFIFVRIFLITLHSCIIDAICCIENTNEFLLLWALCSGY